MKKLIVFMGCSLMAALVAMTSCVRDNGQEENTPEFEIEGYEADVNLSVPCGTKSLFVQYQAQDGTVTTEEVAVTPKIVIPTDGKDVEPFGYVNIHFSASKLCKVDRVYYEAGDETQTVQVDAVSSLILEPKLVPVASTKADDDVAIVTLSEPASYVTTDQDQTFYHSSGVVMIEDSWPSSERGKLAYDYDFDDVIVDYDFEAKVMPERILGARDEQVIAVLHLRCVGSNVPEMVGVKMEGLDMTYVDRVEQFRSLDSWQNPHGTLPAFIASTIGNEEKTRYYVDGSNPVLEIGSLQSVNDKKAGLGADAEYDYGHDSFTNHTVFNLAWGFKGNPDPSQYDEELENYTFRNQNKNITMSEIRKQKYYNCIPGYMNVAGGLFTYTVIFHIKNRAGMSAEESEKVKQMMIDAVNVTTSQNFFCLASPKDRKEIQLKPVGLKGYDPVLIHSESEAAYNKMKAEGAANILADNPYAGTNGQIWAFKCPTRTKHVWNKMYFDMAYPNYEKWIKSEGADCTDWYYEDIDGRFLVCWW